MYTEIYRKSESLYKALTFYVWKNQYTDCGRFIYLGKYGKSAYLQYFPKDECEE